jgi:trigger factor
LKVTAERLPACEVKLTVEVESERFEKPLRQTARRLAKRYRIPGFRPGKAPFNVIVRRFGQEVLLDDVVEQESQGWYEEALEEAELEPFGQAKLEIASYEPLVLAFTLPVAPTVELGEYRDIRVDWEPPSVSDEQVERELARLQQEKAAREPKEEPAELEDVATLDIQGRIGDELVLDLEERAVTLNPDIDYPVAGFAQEIVGMSPGDDREFALVYPEDHANAAWAGQEVHLKVHVRGLEVWVTPQLDDELARSMGEFGTLDEWRESIRKELETQALDQAEQDYGDHVVDALVDQADIEYAPVVVERELDRIMAERDQSLQQRGLGLENYLVVTGQKREEYRESLRETAERRVTRGLVLGKLAQAEELEISDEEVDAEIDRLAESLGDGAEDFRKAFAGEGMRESLRDSLLTRAVVDTLRMIARGEYVPEVRSEIEEDLEPDEILQETPEEIAEGVAEEAEPAPEVGLTDASEVVAEGTGEGMEASDKAADEEPSISEAQESNE